MSKTIIMERIDGAISIKYYRQVERLLRTGEASVNPTRHLVPDEEVNYMITEQLKEQTYGDKTLNKVIEWRKKRLPHRPASDRTKAAVYTAEWFMKKGLHQADYANQRMDVCQYYDKDYWMLATGASPETILAAA